MKTIVNILCFCLISLVLEAQTPQLINYQGVARDNQFNVLANQNIALRLSIFNNATGLDVYSEQHNITTNTLGLFSVKIGSGSNQIGIMTDIDWANENLGLEVEMDPSGGNNFEKIGTTALISVPYALHAHTVDDKDDADADPNNEIQQISKNGNQIMLSNNGGTITDDVNDADADPSNEIQSLQFNVATNMLSLSDGGQVDLSSLDNDGGGNGSGTDDQVISLSGNILSIEDGNSVDLSIIKDGVNDADANPNNELQTIAKNGNTVTLSQNGGSFTDEVNDADASPDNELQTIAKNGNTVTLSQNGGSFTDEVNDADASPDNELQTISKNGNTVSLSQNGGSFTDEVNDADASPDNELQTISKNGNTVSLSQNGGSFTDEVNDADASPNNELQTISKNGNTVSLSQNGGSFTDEVNDADASPNNELQTISKNGNTVTLSQNGGSFTDEVNDADADDTNELQILTLTGNTLGISAGNTVDLTGLGGSSLWNSNGQNIFYTAGDVQTSNQIINNQLTVGPTNSNNAKIDDSGLLVDGTGTGSTLARVGNSEIFVSDNTFANSISMTKDSLRLFMKGANPSVDFKSNLKANFLDFSIGSRSSSYGAQSQIMREDGYELYQTATSQFGYYIAPGNQYNQTFNLGTNVNKNAGHMKLGSTGHESIISLAADELHNGTLEISHQDRLAVWAGSFQSGGLINTFGENESQNTYIGSAQMDPNSNYGGMGVMDANGIIRAGMEVSSNGRGNTYTNGDFSVYNNDNTTLISQMGGFGFNHWYDGVPVVSMGDDFLTQSGGFCTIASRSGSNNFLSGANTEFAGGNDFGFAGVFDDANNYKALMYVMNDGRGVVSTDILYTGEKPAAPGGFLYPIKVNQFSNAGLALENNANNGLWELYVASDGNLSLYSNNLQIGSFDKATGAYTALSDRRAKQNISPLSSVLSNVLTLKPSRYQYIKNNDEGKNSLGFIAQEVEELFPELIQHNTDKNGNEVLTVDYSGFGVLAIKSIQEQQTIIEQQEKSIKLQANEIESLKERLSKIEALLSKEK